MTPRSYFGKMNSILGPVVPLAMFLILCSVLERLPTFCSGEIAFFSKKKLSIFSSRDVAKMFL